MNFFETVRGFLMDPVRSFGAVREKTVSNSLPYYIIILAIGSFLSAIVSVAITSTVLAALQEASAKLGLALPVLTGVGIIAITLFFIVLGIIGVFIVGAWLHLFVYLLGGRQGYGQTVKALMYGSTPLMLIGWIPIIGPVIGGIWSLVLDVLGIRELHQVSTARAVAAVALAFLVLAAIIGFIAAFFIIASSTVTPLPV
jgi:hypothetical protein